MPRIRIERNTRVIQANLGYLVQIFRDAQINERIIEDSSSLSRLAIISLYVSGSTTSVPGCYSTYLEIRYFSGRDGIRSCC